MNLYILQNFNNYTERKCKGYQALSSYLIYVIGTSSNVNFNPNDGKYTDQVVMCDFDTLGYPDYLVVCDDSDEIVSRWFIINVERAREGKWRLFLKHDLVYDNVVDVVKNENTLIKRGYAPITSPAIFNNEDNFSFNQIKKSETYLQQFNIADNGFDCFLIAYIPKNEFGAEDTIVIRGKEQGGTYSDDYLDLKMPDEDYRYTHTEDVPFEIIGVPFKHNWIDSPGNDTLTINIYDSMPNMFDGLEATGTMSVNELLQSFQKLGSFAYDIQVVPYSGFTSSNFRKVSANNIDFSYSAYNGGMAMGYYQIRKQDSNNHNNTTIAIPLCRQVLRQL